MDIIKNPTEMAAKGEKIYQEKFKTAYEEEHLGKFVAIDVNTEKSYLGETAEESLAKAHEEAPRGVFHLIRIGHSGAFRVSYSACQSIGQRYRVIKVKERAVDVCWRDRHDDYEVAVQPRKCSRDRL